MQDPHYNLIAFIASFQLLPKAAARNTLVFPRIYLASVCTTATSMRMRVQVLMPYFLVYKLLHSTYPSIVACQLAAYAITLGVRIQGFHRSNLLTAHFCCIIAISDISVYGCILLFFLAIAAYAITLGFKVFIDRICLLHVSAALLLHPTFLYMGIFYCYFSKFDHRMMAHFSKIWPYYYFPFYYNLPIQGSPILVNYGHTMMAHFRTIWSYNEIWP